MRLRRRLADFTADDKPYPLLTTTVGSASLQKCQVRSPRTDHACAALESRQPWATWDDMQLKTGCNKDCKLKSFRPGTSLDHGAWDQNVTHDGSNRRGTKAQTASHAPIGTRVIEIAHYKAQ